MSQNVTCYEMCRVTKCNMLLTVVCSVVLLVDTSVSNVKYLIHIQHSIRLLLEQQMANKDYFNIVT